GSDAVNAHGSDHRCRGHRAAATPNVRNYWCRIIFQLSMTNLAFEIIHHMPNSCRKAIVFALLSLSVTGCSSSTATKSEKTDASKSTEAQTSAAKKNWTVGMSQCNLGEPWRVQMNADIKAAAEKNPDLKVVFKDAQNDTLRQRAQIEEFVS